MYCRYELYMRSLECYFGVNNFVNASTIRQSNQYILYYVFFHAHIHTVVTPPGGVSLCLSGPKLSFEPAFSYCQTFSYCQMALNVLIAYVCM